MIKPIEKAMMYGMKIAKGFNPTNTWTGNWISFYIQNDGDEERTVKIRYASTGDGFGFRFKKYEEDLGEILNLPATGDWQKWQTTPEFKIKLPKGTYELTLCFFGGGNVNYFELL